MYHVLKGELYVLSHYNADIENLRKNKSNSYKL